MLTNIVLAVLFAWLVVLTVIVYKLKSHYNQLIARTKKRSIDEILDKIVRTLGTCEIEQNKIKNDIEKLNKHSKTVLQKVGIVRFNPFGRSEGEQSFVLAFLNENNDGILLNYISTHDGLKVFSKIIKKGQGDGYNLSKEENEAVEKAN